MNYQEFLTCVRSELANRLTPGATLKIQTIIKNNATHYDGLIILQPGMNIAPTIYLTPYYHRYLNGVSLEDIYDDILTTYWNHLPEADFDTEMFTDFSRASKRIVMRLVNAEYNRSLLSDIPHVMFHDLAIIFYCMIYADVENQGSILIHNSHLDMWHVTSEEIYQLALKNTPTLLPHLFTPMSELLKAHPTAGQLPCNEIPMYILTNTYKTNGASVILYDSLLQHISNRFEKNLIILPSSIHELILIPTDESDSHDLTHYSQIVREVNETQLADDEILSDHAYYYERHRHKIIC